MSSENQPDVQIVHHQELPPETVRPVPTEPTGGTTRVSSPFRRFAGLLGFLHKGEVDAIFNQTPFRPLEHDADPFSLWRRSQAARANLPSLELAVHHVEPIPDEALPATEGIKGRHTYRSCYERFADYHFGMAPIIGLLTPQWQADLDYVEELATKLTPGMSTADLLHFSMPEGTITEPMIRGNQVVFTSTRPDLNAIPVPDVRVVGDGEVEIVVRAFSRPNYVQVAELDGRLVLVNGVHKVLALYRRGYAQVPCLWRQVHHLGETGLNPQQTTLFMDQTFMGPRPAMVIDFLNEQLAAPLTMRSTFNVLRVNIATEVFEVPAVTGLA
jgi:hypothetical protein